MKRGWVFRIATGMGVIFFVALGAATIWMPKVSEEERQRRDRLAEVEVVAQVCIPAATVQFEDMTVSLDGAPSAIQADDGNESGSHAGSPAITAPVTLDASGARQAIVRRWVPGTDERSTSSSFLSVSATQQDSEWIFRFLSGNGISSDGGSGPSELLGSSTSQQPIFELTPMRQDEVLAIHIQREEDGDRVEYWFPVPKQISHGEFSPWQAPVTRETRDDASGTNWRDAPMWRLDARKEILRRPVPADAPKIRYRLMTHEEYTDQYRFWTRTQQALIDQFYARTSGEEREKLLFAPKLLKAIPGC